MFNFPWSNFHELNLDWILSVMKEAKEIFDDGRSDIDYAVSTADEAKTIATQAAQATIADNSISTAKLQDYSVTNPKISNLAVSTDKLQNGSVTTAKIADGAINTSKLADDAITAAKLPVVPIEKGGTGATSSAVARQNLYLPICEKRLLDSDTTKTTRNIYIPNNARLLIIGTSNTLQKAFYVIASSNANGAVAYLEVTKGTDVTLSTSTNILTVTFTSAALANLVFFELGESETRLDAIEIVT